MCFFVEFQNVLLNFSSVKMCDVEIERFSRKLSQKMCRVKESFELCIRYGFLCIVLELF